MTTFLRLLEEKDKKSALESAIREGSSCVFDVDPASFKQVPGAPFAYWVSEEIRELFCTHPPFQSGSRDVRQGLATANDFRFLRTWWEHEWIIEGSCQRRWFPFTKGGIRSPYYADISLSLNWQFDGKEIKAWADPLYGNSGWSRILKSTNFYFRPGLTWPLRGIVFSAQAVPRDCIFSVAGKMAFAPEDEMDFWLAIFNSCAFDYLIGLFAGKVGGVQYEAGLIGGIPITPSNHSHAATLSRYARRAWVLRRILDTVEETSHAFLLPAALRTRLGDYDPPSIEAELTNIQTEIDEIAFDLYGFNDADRTAALASSDAAGEDTSDGGEEADAFEDENSAELVDQTDGLLSWSVGVAFGRFDWRLATGERAAPSESEPFDPLPAKSPGMLPNDAEPFHDRTGLLVDDQGHTHDLARLIEEVLTQVDVPIPVDVRRWLQRKLFPFHLKQYSKSRRKAPIYWPLSTESGGYTLWLYYPSLTDQTLYTVINDFIEPKLKQVKQDLAALRTKGSARSRADEERFEALQALEHELIELRDTLLEVAPSYRPNQDDGVQITAAPLWRLFQHKPWQKVLKDTWAKLEKGEYDWAHLAMTYWPERVREKCKSDKSLAIAHDLEHLYEEPKAESSSPPSRSQAGGR